ncbi:3-hydroxyisobutyrate dehydrogenase [Corynebacterium ciconiae DSM 44920]|uniref:3-hydroxyisobutyrate dehydrogenase n=1 Tax=Corynebacterium ciconiae TaxID=227319 RepID=UPI000376FB58|nr:3-hydroxyisobutyrate dehydrogenase [Corynebacterium ciconiae]WKD62225.1 3-hydroxyisobutyrate dehydrogenase [Corynebacterium ciconiae DSM 44920]
MTTIAFIGLGNMGGPMASNLIAAGYTVTGFDVMEPAIAAAREAGVDIRDSAAAAARDASIVITMLPNGALVDATLQEIIAEHPGSALFIDSSTIGVDEATRNAATAAEAGHSYIDAPVSGGVVGAQAGQLAFMVGGEEQAVEQARPVLEVLGKSLTHCGGPGAGAAAKLCNNMILGVQQIAIAEGMVLGERLGLSPEAFFEVVSNSTGSCWALTTNCPEPGVVASAPSNKDFAAGFSTNLICKDLGLAIESAAHTGTDTQLGRHALELFTQLQEAGEGARDFSVVINQVRAAQ